MIYTGIDPNDIIREAQKLRASGEDDAEKLKEIAKSSMSEKQADEFEKLLSDSEAMKRLLESDAAKKLLEGLGKI